MPLASLVVVLHTDLAQTKLVEFSIGRQSATRPGCTNSLQRRVHASLTGQARKSSILDPRRQASAKSMISLRIGLAASQSLAAQTEGPARSPALDRSR